MVGRLVAGTGSVLSSMRLLLGVIIVKVSVPVAGLCVSLKRKRSKVAGSPSAMQSAALFGAGADGLERVADEVWVGLVVAQVVDDAGVVLDGGGLPAGDGGEVERRR